MIGEMQLKPLKFEGDSVNYIAPSWDVMNQLTYELSQLIRASSTSYDRIVTLAKGGWPMTRSLIDFTQIPDIASVGIKFYSGINQKLDKPAVYQDLPVEVEGEKILLFDDVADTGGSLLFTKKLLLQKGAESVSTATIFYKPHSQLKPDYFGVETSAWIVFPFETFEMIELIGKKWLENGLTQEVLKTRFARFNFPQEFLEDAIGSLLTSFKE